MTHFLSVKKELKFSMTMVFFYTVDEDLSLLVLNVLRNKNLTISFAESITGGNVSSELVKNPDASTVFLGGIVSYSNALKCDILGVSEEALRTVGAASEPVVKEMVFGLKKQTKADICIALSGIAGPGGGSSENPLGLCTLRFCLKMNAELKGRFSWAIAVKLSIDASISYFRKF